MAVNPQQLREKLAAKEFRYVEAAGVTLNDTGWNELTAKNNRHNLSPISQNQMQNRSMQLWEGNLLANRIIELPLAYLLAEGFEIKVQDNEAQKIITAFVNDPITNLEKKIKRKIRSLLMFGEQVWPAFVNEFNGHVRLGSIDPSQIETIVSDPDNAEQPIGIITTRNGRHRSKRYQIIINGTESDLFSRRTQEIRSTFSDGLVFYNVINELSGGGRGRGVLLAQIDWLDAYDEFLFGELDRAQLMRAFFWDVSLNGATEQQVVDRAKQIKTPSPGSTRVHNDGEIWKAESPNLNAGESETIARLIRNTILGGATQPEHWFGGGGDVNRSTADSMGEPTFKVLSSLQNDIASMLKDVAIFAINRNYDPTGKEVFIDPYDPDPEYEPEVIFPELTSTDTSRYATALTQVVSAATIAVDADLITKETAIKMINAISARLGVEFDASEELQKANEQNIAKQSNDIFHQTEELQKANEQDIAKQSNDVFQQTTEKTNAQ